MFPGWNFIFGRNPKDNIKEQFEPEEVPSDFDEYNWWSLSDNFGYYDSSKADYLDRKDKEKQKIFNIYFYVISAIIILLLIKKI